MNPVLLDNGNLLVPATALGDDGTIGDGMLEITPDSPEYQEWLPFVQKKAKLRLKGGEGSGFHGHAGIPGHQGGSQAATDVTTLMADPAKWTMLDDLSDQGISSSTLVKVAGDGKAIVKPPLEDDYPFRDSYCSATDSYHEADAYAVAQALGWDIVPPSAMANNAFEEGQTASVQQWVEGAKTVYDYRREAPEKHTATDIDVERFRQVAWLDVIIGNYDRHGSNLVVVEKNKVATPVAIDNGISFDVKRYTIDKQVKDSGSELYDTVMDSHFDDILGGTKIAYNEEGQRRSVQRKQISRKQYTQVLGFINDTNNPTRRALVNRYGDEWYIRASKRVDDVAQLAEKRLFGYSWTD